MQFFSLLLLCSLLLTSSTNLYSDPEVGSCSAEESGTEPGCGCGSLKRDSSQTTTHSGLFLFFCLILILLIDDIYIVTHWYTVTRFCNLQTMYDYVLLCLIVNLVTVLLVVLLLRE